VSELVIQFKYLKEFLIIFEEFLALTGEKVIPCTSTEVDVLESMLPHPYRLPLAYKEFLLYGGHRMGSLTSAAELDYRGAEIQLEIGYHEDFFPRVYGSNENGRIPSDIFLIMEHQSYYYQFFLLTEGEDPPVYSWEKGKGGLVECDKFADSFSDFLWFNLKNAAAYKFSVSWDEIQAGKRGKRFWVPIDTEFKEGITPDSLMGCFGFCYLSHLEDAATIAGLDPDSYLEELSGWKKRPVTENGTTTTRFFPPETKEE
jgi:SMI1-KNR4 cell-wall